MYQDLTEFELAARRIERRRRNVTQLTISIIMTALFIALYGVAGPGYACFGILIPITFFFVVARTIELYHESPRHLPSQERTEHQLTLLFGEDWRETTGIKEYALAQDRLIRYGKKRWWFVIHLLIAVPSIILISIALINTLPPGGIMWMVLGLLPIWLIILIRQGREAFPSHRALERRERAFGSNLRREFRFMQPESPKTKEKLKRGMYYTIGDDGELVEVEEDKAVDDEKPKRERRG